MFFGCDAQDAAEVQKHLKQVAVAKAVQEALLQQNKVRTSPTPPAVVSSSPSSSSSASACTRGKPLKQGRGLLCQRCLVGPGSHAKHTVGADNCILFGRQNLTPHQVKMLLFNQDVQAAAEDAVQQKVLATKRGRPPGSHSSLPQDPPDHRLPSNPTASTKRSRIQDSIYQQRYQCHDEHS